MGRARPGAIGIYPSEIRVTALAQTHVWFTRGLPGGDQCTSTASRVHAIATPTHELRLGDNTQMPNVVMRTANLSHADLSYAMAHGAKLPDCNLIGAKLDHTDLRNAELSRSALMDAELTGTDLTGVDVSTFDSSRVKLDAAILSAEPPFGGSQR